MWDNWEFSYLFLFTCDDCLLVYCYMFTGEDTPFIAIKDMGKVPLAYIYTFSA